MSCYEWERGTIIIPRAQWASFRKGLLTKWNEHQAAYLSEAKRAYARVKDATKGKRGAKRQQAIKASLEDACRRRIIGGYGGSEVDPDKYYRLSNVLLQWAGYDKPRKLTTPKAKDFPKVAVSKSCTLNLVDADVTFDNDTHSVTWEVDENNHACERARRHWFAEALFQALRHVTWTRGSGGKIIGNNEYNRDAGSEGGGGNYVVDTYGPETKRSRRDLSYHGYSYHGY